MKVSQSKVKRTEAGRAVEEVVCPICGAVIRGTYTFKNEIIALNPCTHFSFFFSNHGGSSVFGIFKEAE